MILKKLLPFLLLSLFFTATNLLAEDEREKSKAEEMVGVPTQQDVDINTLVRGKLTEEQAVSQLKYMMVQGWGRMEADLLERGSFKPFGMVLSPQGEFKPLVVDVEVQDDITQDMALGAIVKNLKAIAETRSQWAVGLMYVTGKQKEDGSYDKRITVIAEHIAGWGRAWSYPYKIIDGEVKLGSANEVPMDPVYFK